MRKSLITSLAAAVVAGLFTVAPASADTFSVEAGATSNNVWRGLSKSNGNPTVYGAVQLETGDAYVRLSGTSVDMKALSPDTTEFVLEAGYNYGFGDRLDVQAGASYYQIGDDIGYVEVFARPSLDVTKRVRVKGEVAYTPKAALFENARPLNGLTQPIDEGYWASAGVEADITKVMGFDLTGDANVGYHKIDGLDEYTTYNTGVTASTIDGLYADVRYYDNVALNNFLDQNFDKDNITVTIGYKLTIG